MIELEYVEKKVSHTLKRGWWRVYLENFMEILTGIYGNMKQLDVVEFILDNLNTENQLTLTQRMVAAETQTALATVNKIFQYLIKHDFMRKKGTVYIVNPKYICAFGSDKKNATIAVNYSYDEPTLPNL